MALGSENCNTALVCLSSGSWITSSQWKIDFAAIIVLSFILLKPRRAPMLLYDTIWRLCMRLNVRFRVIRPKLSQPNELKFSPRCLLTPLMGGITRAEYGLWWARCSGSLIFQPDFYLQFYPELNVQRCSYFSYDHPCKAEEVLGGCKRGDCSGP